MFKQFLDPQEKRIKYKIYQNRYLLYVCTMSMYKETVVILINLASTFYCINKEMWNVFIMVFFYLIVAFAEHLASSHFYFSSLIPNSHPDSTLWSLNHSGPFHNRIHNYQRALFISHVITNLHDSSVEENYVWLFPS